MIIFPMAGLSACFAAAGHQLPKYMLPLWSGTVFDRAVAGFPAEFSEKPLRSCSSSATTVALGTRRILNGDAGGSSLTIFNIDTFRPGFCRPAGFDEAAADGRLFSVRHRPSAEGL